MEREEPVVVRLGAGEHGRLGAFRGALAQAAVPVAEFHAGEFRRRLGALAGRRHVFPERLVLDTLQVLGGGGRVVEVHQVQPHQPLARRDAARIAAHQGLHVLDLAVHRQAMGKVSPARRDGGQPVALDGPGDGLGPAARGDGAGEVARGRFGVGGPQERIDQGLGRGGLGIGRGQGVLLLPHGDQPLGALGRLGGHLGGEELGGLGGRGVAVGVAGRQVVGLLAQDRHERRLVGGVALRGIEQTLRQGDVVRGVARPRDAGHVGPEERLEDLGRLLLGLGCAQAGRSGRQKNAQKARRAEHHTSPLPRRGDPPAGPDPRSIIHHHALRVTT
ncbi:MAG: hypothetical protein AMS14_00440 [Planctomycetes bacterium DG_20]|nr:MAG: hypothetical protein AMS14_00440 [Planctomycetes bacterium DG_20]